MPTRRLLGPGLLVLTVLILGRGVPAAAEEPAKTPAIPDDNPRLQWKQARFSASVRPTEARPGETVEFQVTVELDSGWHIYAYSANPAEAGEGPTSTQFDFFDTAGLQLVSDWAASRPPLRKRQEAWPKIPFVESYEGEVTWTAKLQVPPGLEPGPRTLRCQVYFQICTEKSCLKPIYRTLPGVTLTVLPGEANTAAARGAPSPPPSPPAAASVRAEGALESGPRSEADEAIDRGLVPFLLFSAGGGLLALVMPCVWPMVPVTVNFFVKQGQKNKGKTFSLALTYCVSIIAIFTLVGVLFAAFMGATSLQQLANTAWLNLTVAAILIVFGLSLLGLFELRLPSFLLNASAQGESRGGLIGVFFMALTLTITSFTCTFPVVGGLIVIASRGSYFYPVLGLATFATVLALPFFVLALAPSVIQRVPKSGDWMNAVKVVGGLIELGAAFKFVNTAEIALGATPDSAWFDAQVVLSIWVVLSVVCGLYLLGLFRTDHDHEPIQVGPMRLLFGSAFLGLALYLAPALFGNPPESRFYGLVAGIIPPDDDLVRPTLVAESDAAGAVAATDPDPETAQRQQRIIHGVSWGMSFEQALEQAQAEKRPILIDFTGVNCVNCRTMEREVLRKPEVRDLLEKFVTVALYTDILPIKSITPAQRREYAQKNALRQLDMVNDATNPFYVVLTPEGKPVATTGFTTLSGFKAFLTDALMQLENGGALARTP